MKTIKQILIGMAMLSCFGLHAQDLDSAFVPRMNYIFQHVNSNTVASGLLKDYGLEFIDIAAYNGVPADSNYQLYNFITLQTL